ncbi:MAG: ankyrin repeat domain-containing protein [Leptolyngbyaceae bacterium]|nr:ankyrin repeat domain-containing protein [Leptolyngbyaceae bacterium]
MSLEAGLTAFKRGHYADAIAHLDTYCAECETLGSTGSRNYMQAGMALVKAYHAEKKFDKAIAQCEVFMASDKNPALKIWADKTFPKLQDAQNAPEPEPKSEEESKLAAESYDALKLLESGIAAQKRGDDKAAIDDLEAYLETCTNVRSRNFMQAQISRVKAYRSLGQLERAHAICEELQAIDNAALQSWASKAISALGQAGGAPAATASEPSDETQSESVSTDSENSHLDTDKLSVQSPEKRSPAPIPRKPPIRPGVARMLDNTSTVEISAAASASSFPSEPSSQSASVPSSHPGSSHHTTSSSRSGTSHSRSSSSKAPTAAGTGVAALLGGGLLVMLTKPVFRRFLFAIIGLTIGVSRACLGGGFTGSDSYTDESYSDYTADALHDAACNGDPQEAQALIQNGTSVDVIDSEGNTPLFLAVSGCSSNYETYPVTEGHRAVITLLINNGASTSSVNNYGQTPLHWAAAWGPADVTTSLVSYGANVGAVDEYQDTPLHWAAWAGNDSSAEALANLGVPLSPINADGDTPLDVARNFGSYSTAELLQGRGATAKTTY